jgi:hypothetical protein
MGMTHAQTTSASGVVRDSISGEVLSYVSVIFDKSMIGAMTDDNGAFSLQNDKGFTKLVISSLGYDTKTIMLKRGSKNSGLNIKLRPTSFELAEVVVRPKHERYTKKNNPAVDLIKKVIEMKDENRVESKDVYSAESYEKLSLALDNFNPNLDKNKFMKKFSFIKNYIDTSEFNGKPILTVSVREQIADVYYRKHPKSEKTIVTAKRQQGIDNTLDDSGALTSNLEEIFKGINIFDNNINILLNRFVSPLSSVIATQYYKYYIIDTLAIGGEKCIDLGFVPVNSESYGFTGHLYITTDGKYAVKKYLLNTPADINLNWVDKLRIDQDFERMPDSTWVPGTSNTYINFYVVKGAQQLYAHQVRNFSKIRLRRSQERFHLRACRLDKDTGNSYHAGRLFLGQQPTRSTQREGRRHRRPAGSDEKSAGIQCHDQNGRDPDLRLCANLWKQEPQQVRLRTDEHHVQCQPSGRLPNPFGRNDYSQLKSSLVWNRLYRLRRQRPKDEIQCNADLQLQQESLSFGRASA